MENSIVPIISNAVAGKSGMGANKQMPKGHAAPPKKASFASRATHRANSNLAISPAKGKHGGKRSPTK